MNVNLAVFDIPRRPLIIEVTAWYQSDDGRFFGFAVQAQRVFDDVPRQQVHDTAARLFDADTNGNRFAINNIYANVIEVTYAEFRAAAESLGFEGWPS